MRQRMLVLGDLEPYRHLSRKEVMELQGKGIATIEDVIIKLNFPDFIRRFERENMDVVEFGSDADYDKKIQAVSERLKAYAQEKVVVNPNNNNPLNN